MRLGCGWVAGLVFPGDDGEPWWSSNFARACRRVFDDAGLIGSRLHDLRHAHATMLLRAGVRPKVVSERLGHSSISLTLDVYSHVMPGMQGGSKDRRGTQGCTDCLVRGRDPQDHAKAVGGVQLFMLVRHVFT